MTMGTKVDRKTWVTFVDILRFVTPALVSLLVYQVQSFQHSLDENTRAIQQMQVSLARIDEKQQRMADDTKENKETIARLSADSNDNKRDIQGLSLRFASLERMRP